MSQCEVIFNIPSRLPLCVQSAMFSLMLNRGFLINTYNCFPVVFEHIDVKKKSRQNVVTTRFLTYNYDVQFWPGYINLLMYWL